MCTKDDFIELMMGADTPLEALSIYYGGMKHLENCQFIFFDFSQGNCPIPNLVNSEYMEPSKGPGYAIQTLSCNENFWVLDKKCFYEMMRHQKSDVLLKVCLDFDTQMLTYLEKYHSDQAATPQSLHKLLSEVESAGVDYSCAPYAIENSYKIGDPKIEQGMVRSLVAFSHYKNNPLHDFSLNLPYSNEDWNGTHELLAQLKRLPFLPEVPNFGKTQKYIYCLLLECAIISLSFNRISPVKRMEKLLDFTNNELGVVLERELSACYLYFQHSPAIQRFFKRITPDTKTILKDIAGMAWDLTHLRALEWLTGFDSAQNENGEFTLHALVTKDCGLQEIIRAVPLQRMAIIHRDNTVFPIVKCTYGSQLQDLLANDGLDIVETLDQQRGNRQRVYTSMNCDALILKLESSLLAAQHINK